jgi:hypothetical protein
MADPSRSRKRWLHAAGAVIVLLFVLALVWPAIEGARLRARINGRVQNMCYVWGGLKWFDDSYGLPPPVRRDEAGRPLSSWRFQITPYLEGMMIDIDYNERWDAPIHRWLARRPHACFCYGQGSDPVKQLHTNLVTITGHGTAFEEDRTVRLADLAGDTILLIEMADSGIHWMEPGDLDVEDVPESITRGVDAVGVLVVFADGAVWLLRPDVPLSELKKFFTIESAKRYDRDEVLRPYANESLAAYWHP